MSNVTMMELSRELDEQFDRLLKECMVSGEIDQELYTEYDVKRGLRDANGKGVLTGLTEISDVLSYKSVDGKKMPADNITLYAKWQAPVVKATVYLTASADGASKTIEISYGTKLSDSEAFKKLLDEEFTEEKPSAWIDSNGALFNVDTKLYGSVTISPFFPSAKDGFTVTYVEGTNVKTDNQKYVSGSSARVLPPENSENFRAWKMEDGTLIHPGDKITVTKNTTLRAVYTKNPKTETITYHYNFEGSTDTYTDDNGGKGYPRNTTATVK